METSNIAKGAGARANPRSLDCAPPCRLASLAAGRAPLGMTILCGPVTQGLRPGFTQMPPAKRRAGFGVRGRGARATAGETPALRPHVSAEKHGANVGHLPRKKADGLTAVSTGNAEMQT